MEYVYIAPPPKPKEEADEKPRCPEANDACWAESMVDRGFFLSIRHALEFLESWRPLSKPVENKTDGLFTKINTDDPFA